jgi:capsular polysaccharide biosynthesis protein
MTLEEMLYALLRRWKLIAFGAVFTGLVALGVSFVVPPTYEAVSTVAIAKSTVAVNFDEKLRTLTEEELLVLFRREQDLKERRKALEGLVQNAAIAQKVLEQLGDQLPDRLRQPGELIKIVEGKLVGDSIEIRVRADNPTVAAAIANAWGREYEKHINSIYATTVQGEALPDVQREAARAWSEYLKAQEELQKFIAENNIDKINRLIEEKKAILTSLSEGQRQAVKTVVDTELEARSKIISAYVNALTDNLLLAFQKEQEEKRKLLTEYFATELQNRLLALEKDRELRRKLFTNLADAEIENWLLALEKDRELRRKLFTNLADAEIENRLLALEKDRELRRKLFISLADTEIANRLLALEKDQELRRKLFTSLADAEIQARTAVFNQQTTDKIQKLATAYTQRRMLQQLLENAQALRQQVEAGGTQATAVTSGLSLLLLKAQAFASTGDLPAKLELSLLSTEGLAASPQEQVKDLEALISALEQQIQKLDQSISEQSTALLQNEGYDFLAVDPEKEAPLSQAIVKRYQELFELGQLPSIEPEGEASLLQAIAKRYQELFELGQLPSIEPGEGTSLSQAIAKRYRELFELGQLPSIEPKEEASLLQAIAKRYQELFELGQLQQLGQQSYSETSLIETIKAKHPELFQIGEIAKLSDLVAAGNPLAASAQAVSERLLQLQGLEDIPTYTAAAKPLAEAIDKLDKEINALQAQLESEQARKKELVRARDLAWEKYNTLANKVAEVDVASAITGTEVRFAKPAFVPKEPVSPKKAQNALLGLFAGLVLAMGFVLLKEHPLFNGGHTRAVEEKSNENLATHVQG